mmetsp:Transcript_22395/g.72693  ORF Transcript_22395/g.72693 Transcript_22395/m.72693 type:complete len:370 (+) Transcript_22395:160-1269(+)
MPRPKECAVSSTSAATAKASDGSSCMMETNTDPGRICSASPASRPITSSSNMMQLQNTKSPSTHDNSSKKSARFISTAVASCPRASGSTSCTNSSHNTCAMACVHGENSMPVAEAKLGESAASRTHFPVPEPRSKKLLRFPDGSPAECERSSSRNDVGVISPYTRLSSCSCGVPSSASITSDLATSARTGSSRASSRFSGPSDAHSRRAHARKSNRVPTPFSSRSRKMASSDRPSAFGTHPSRYLKPSICGGGAAEGSGGGAAPSSPPPASPPASAGPPGVSSLSSPAWPAPCASSSPAASRAAAPAAAPPARAAHAACSAPRLGAASASASAAPAPAAAPPAPPAAPAAPPPRRAAGAGSAGAGARWA